MISAPRTIQSSFLFFSVALAGTTGCATVAGGHGQRRDLHSSARVVGDAPRVLVSGAALLMHVEVEGRDDLALYAVPRKDGTEIDCAAPAIGERRLIRPGVPNLVNLTVAANQTICIAAAPSTRSVSVAWHARRADANRAANRGDALALDAVNR